MNRIKLSSLDYRIILPSTLYFLMGIYMSIYPILYDKSLYWIILLSIFCIVSSIGLFLLKRWGLWLAIIISPFIIVTLLAALGLSTNLVGFAPNIQTEIFHLSFILLVIFSLFSILSLIDSRKKFE
ncbi:MAG: hypothetical protein NWE86_00985 [Candidatus Bathyarchaeota archaeon]|nr:hypothetical protein [Candidatus Bathyarchaeota archaeon]